MDILFALNLDRRRPVAFRRPQLIVFVPSDSFFPPSRQTLKTAKKSREYHDMVTCCSASPPERLRRFHPPASLPSRHRHVMPSTERCAISVSDRYDPSISILTSGC